MDSEVKILLEQILVARVVDRARNIRIAWRALNKDDAEGKTPVDKEPAVEFFIDQAVAEIKEFRERIIAKLITDQ